MVSMFTPRWKRILRKWSPFLFRQCPHGNYGWRWNYACWCMINSSNNSKWSFAIALRIKENKWIPVKEYIEIICSECSMKNHVPKYSFESHIVKCWKCEERIDKNAKMEPPKQVEVIN